MDGFDGPVKDVKPGEISVLDSPDSKPRILAIGEGPIISPGGQKVAFCAPDKDGRYHSQVINFDGSGVSELMPARQNVCPSAWLAYGEKLAFTEFGSKTQMVAIADVDGRNYRTITEGFDPQWSPDGKQLVYYRDFDSKKNRIAIWIVNVDGTGARKIIEADTPPPPSASWNSLGAARFFQGTQILFSSLRSHSWCIFRVNLDGTGLTELVENDQFDLFNPVISPAGDQLVVQGDSRPNNSMGKPEKVILLLEFSPMHWTQLASGTSPSALWLSVSPFNKMVIQESQATPIPSANQSLIAQGKSRYLAYKCDECHGANGEGGPDGPALTTTYMDAGQISRFLERPSPDAYMKGMPNIPVNHPDHQALVAYVLSLKRAPMQ
jgi:Tol biopolymer transport system component